MRKLYSVFSALGLSVIGLTGYSQTWSAGWQGFLHPNPITTSVSIGADNTTLTPYMFRVEGKAFIGYQFYNSHDPDQIMTLSLKGQGPSGSGSKISFGTVGYSYNLRNVFVGEFGDAIRSSQLWLHGDYGTYITRLGGLSASTYTSVLAYCPSPTIDGFYFTTKVFSKDVLLASDERFKSNIVQIQTPLKKILSLRGVSYEFDYTPKVKKLEESLKGYYPSSMETEKTPSEMKMGFIAQELQKIFPDLVKEDDLGFLAVDYIGLIPVIVEAMKEQQAQIETLIACCNKGTQKSMQFNLDPMEDSGVEDLKVYQNMPNPFNEKTSIRCFVPESIKKADLCVYDMSGTLIKCLVVSERGEVFVQIHAEQLAAGIYTYLLFGDGKTSDAKNMILTK